MIEVAITTAPVPTASGKPDVVGTAMRNILNRCNRLRLKSIAIPALGTGTGGLAVEKFAMLAIQALSDTRAEAPCRVVFVMWDADAYAAMERAFRDAGGVSTRDHEAAEPGSR